MSLLYLAAAHKSSGKTTAAIGLCAALRAKGHRVQPFKKGPDYIDPLWLSRAADRPCYNLDFHTMNVGQLRQMVDSHSVDADIVVIEGNKGLFDGVDLHGKDSNAALAQLYDAPVLLVIDTRGMTRGIAPLIVGYQEFEPKVTIAGVVLNRVGGVRHEAKLRAAVNEYTDVPVVGALPQDPSFVIEERHLGLVPSNEATEVAERIQRLQHAVMGHLDLDLVVSLASRASPSEPKVLQQTVTVASDVRIGIPRDAAFGFYYPDDLEGLQRAGAELVFFDSLYDPALPEVDGLFLGGGFPETQMKQLEANTSMRRDILSFVRDGGPVYAECGGLMYLARRLRWAEQRCEMVGALPLDVVMHERPIGRGYVNLLETGQSPWGSVLSDGEGIVHAHEFHYSKVENLGTDCRFAFKVERGYGFDGEHDGLIHRNVVASYAHLRSVTPVCWTDRFVEHVRHYAQ